MKKLIPVVVIIVILAAIFGSTYNKLTGLDNQVDVAWSQVENTMQRRADLIPNLVETVKGYAQHEEDVFTQVTNARSAVNNAQTPEEYAEANEQMNEAMRSINVVVEAYPELKANENFQNLQAELAGTENRIAVERQRYNETVGDYNLSVRRFPTNLVAGILGFQQRQYFEISEGASEVPQVQF
ncbi:LemA family protein [Peptoniphilus sp. KCTC 25270]|uniref:LemA family protein n=1 Tax=Peptoniphilus sp. KCTC 25270 TaxID=2897414 RepID=UPI001E2ED4A8|nr:LemA family protein [Peptoniphilus sp. KCTC 25270]MCD1148028.1 LemA family protein [Peptoniphilus sp. KCTC 25270]